MGTVLPLTEGINCFVDDHGDGTGTITVKGDLEGVLPVPISIVPDGIGFVINFKFDNGVKLQYSFIITS